MKKRRNPQHRKYSGLSKSMLCISLCTCLAVLIFAVWLLFIPNTYNRLEAIGSNGIIAANVENQSSNNTTDTPSGFLAVLVNDTAQLDSDLNWSSSDTAIATVDKNGIVTGIKQGTCQMTADDITFQVTVRQLEQKNGCTYVDDILIVNKSYALPADFDPGLDPTAESAFDQLCDTAAAEGLNLYDGSDYRDYAYQVKIYNNYCELYGWEKADTFSARPGYSEHQSGLTIDCNTIDDAFGETPEAAWLAQHCAEYGFIIRFPQGKESITGYKYEPWHIRYVGTAIAKEIQSFDLTLEEYLGVDSVYAEPWQG